MIDSAEPLQATHYSERVIQDEFKQLDEKYQSLSQRFRTLGDIIFLEEEFKHEYLLGIALGFRELSDQDRDSGDSLLERDLQIGNIPFIDNFYDRESRIFSKLVRKANAKGDKYRIDVNLEINKRISQMQKDKKYFREMEQLSQAVPHRMAFLFGASMIRGFVLENASKQSAKPREIVK